jgi:hypothetical protein
MAQLGTKPHQDTVELGAPVATFKYYDTRGNITASVVRYEPDGTREGKTFRPYCFRTIDGKQKWMAGAPDLRPLYRLPELALTSQPSKPSASRKSEPGIGLASAAELLRVTR